VVGIGKISQYPTLKVALGLVFLRETTIFIGSSIIDGGGGCHPCVRRSVAHSRLSHVQYLAYLSVVVGRTAPAVVSLHRRGRGSACAPTIGASFMYRSAFGLMGQYPTPPPRLLDDRLAAGGVAKRRVRLKQVHSIGSPL